MTKAKKRLLTLLLAMLMAVALTVSVCAQSSRLIDADSISSSANTQLQLNCDVPSYPVNGTKLTLYYNTNDPSQRWIYTRVPNTTRDFFLSSGANASVYITFTGANAQATVNSQNNATVNNQKITLIAEATSTQEYADHGFAWGGQYALTASSLYSTGPVTWQGPNGTKNQLWVLQMYPSV